MKKWKSYRGLLTTDHSLITEHLPALCLNSGRCCAGLKETCFLSVCLDPVSYGTRAKWLQSQTLGPDCIGLNPILYLL